MGCAGFGANSQQTIELPILPNELIACFSDKVPAPKPGKMTVQQAYDLIAKLKRSETKMSQCGKRFQIWYETLAGGTKGK